MGFLDAGTPMAWDEAWDDERQHAEHVRHNGIEYRVIPGSRNHGF